MFGCLSCWIYILGFVRVFFFALLNDVKFTLGTSPLCWSFHSKIYCCFEWKNTEITRTTIGTSDTKDLISLFELRELLCAEYWQGPFAPYFSSEKSNFDIWNKGWTEYIWRGLISTETAQAFGNGLSLRDSWDFSPRYLVIYIHLTQKAYAWTHNFSLANP